MAHYFASREWVFISISYRTADDLFIDSPSDDGNESNMQYLRDKNLDEIVPSAWKDWTIEKCCINASS